MNRQRLLILTVPYFVALVLLGHASLEACCPAPRGGGVVLNADQTVIMIWDAAKQTQHFIRQATFASKEQDFGFLIPSPTQPELEEAGNEAFPYLAKLTAPEVIRRPLPRDTGCGCGLNSANVAGAAPENRVTVLAEKQVAGFNAVVLEAKSADALVTWLKDHGYAYSPQIEAWAKPYVEQGWKITALKVAGDAKEPGKGIVNAAALRMSFKTDRPLFPYREPDYGTQPTDMNQTSRLLRIFFIAEARYEGTLTPREPWTGRVAWAGQVKAEDKTKLLELLKLPAQTGPATWWLTEFEDRWPYKVAPADVYFAKATDQSGVKRPPTIIYTSSVLPTDGATYALAGLMLLPLARRWRRRSPRAADAAR